MFFLANMVYGDVWVVWCVFVLCILCLVWWVWCVVLKYVAPFNLRKTITVNSLRFYGRLMKTTKLR